MIKDIVRTHFAVNREVTSRGHQANRIPLLSQLFEEFPEVMMNIDLKHNSKVLAQKVSELIKEYKRENRTI